MVEIYARPDGTIAHITDDSISITPEADTTQVIQFDINSYLTEYQHVSSNTKAAFWDGANLQINGVVYLDNAWIAARQAEIEQVQQEQSAEIELATTFAYIRQHLPGLKVLQLKMLGYVQMFGDDPDNFGTTQLSGVYADLKAAFVPYPYWQNRLKLFIKRRAFGQGISAANISAMFTRINEGTETAQDKALIWDAAETLIAQATTAALLSK